MSYEITVQGEDREGFDLAFQIGFLERKYSIGWKLDDKHGLILYSYAEEGITRHPSPLDYKYSSDIAWLWLKSLVKYDEFAKWAGGKPDTDGSVEKGYLITNDGFWFAEILAVKPAWIVYGK